MFQPTSYAGGVFTRGGLPRYPSSSPMSAYADGALGCTSCAGVGATTSTSTIDWSKVLTAADVAQIQAMQAAAARQRMWKIGLIGVSVLAVGAIGYVVLKGK